MDKSIGQGTQVGNFYYDSCHEFWNAFKGYKSYLKYMKVVIWFSNLITLHLRGI